MVHTCRGVFVAGVAALGLLAGSARAAQAQEAVVRGTISSDRAELVAVAAVQIPELSLQAFTGANGRYQISIPAARVQGQTVTIRVRAIGYKPLTRTLVLSAGEHEVDFTLVTDANMLEAIVVTGVQDSTRQVLSPLTVQRVDVSVLPLASPDPLRQLQGKVGANIVSGTGRPGTQASVVLRGPTSLNAAGRSQDPLYIVDGIMINGNLPEISPQDIESVEVLKGAAGASLYGARAGNGVISIKTKSGNRALDGAVTFGVRTEAGVSDIERDFGIARFHALLTDETGTRFCAAVTGQPLCARTFDYAAEAARVNNTPGDFTPSAPGFPLDPGSSISPSAVTGRTGNVLKEQFQLNPWPGVAYNAVAQSVDPQPFTQNSLDLTGRFGGTRFYVSGTNLSERGAIRFLHGFQRNSFRANVDQIIGTTWNVGITAFYSRSADDGSNNDGGNNAFFLLTRQPAIANNLARDTLGRLYIRPNLQGGGGQNSNPLYTFENALRDDISSRFIGGATVNFTPLNWLTFSSSIGYDQRRASFAQIQDKGFRTTSSTPLTNNGFIFRGAAGAEAVDANVSASVRRRLGQDLNTRFTARYLFEQRDEELNTGQGRSLSVKGVTSLGNVTTNQAVASTFTRIRQIGGSLHGSFEYKERYILDALVRHDGSSLFGAGNRWATFGRVSGAWRASQESWWFLPQVNELKFRASYGTAGGSPNFSAQYETFNIGAGGLLTLTTLGNRNLKPEMHHEMELGADLELFNRYGLTATYARSHIDQQILQVPVSSSTGYQNQWQNAGQLLNITHELSLNIPITRRRDVSWSMSLVYDHNRSWISRLDVAPYTYGAGQQGTEQMFQAQQGERVGTFYGRAFLRDCSQLPAPYNGDCGSAGSSFQTNDEGWLVWVGAGNDPGMGVTHNLWETALPGAQAPWGVGLNWGMPIVLRGDPNNISDARRVALGNALPDFRFAVTQNVQYRRLSLYVLLDASIGQKVWNEGFHWAHLDFLSHDVDQAGKSVETAKPIGYYYRAAPPDNGSGVGGFYDLLGPNNFTVEDASYAKLRELAVSYDIGRVAGAGNWSVTVVGRNLFTITGYRGFDPEVGIASNPNGNPGGNPNTNIAGSRAINAVDAFVFPNLRTFTVRLATTF
jgi:TonB-linked SusC/RagA family outer membrane protein